MVAVKTAGIVKNAIPPAPQEVKTSVKNSNC